MKTNSFKENFASLNKHIKRHNILMIIASSIVTAVALLFVLYWEYDYNDISFAIDTIYLIGNLFFFVISLALTVLLVLSRFIKFKTNALAIIIHIYVLLLIAWDTCMCVLDLRLGYSPVAYLMILTLGAGLFVVEPLFFAVVITASFAVVTSMALVYNAPFFSGVESGENLINFFTFFAIVLLTAGEHYGMVINDQRVEKKLEHLTYYDDLTGLLNERSYLKEIEDLDVAIENEEIKEYAVMLMDLNNLKVTNDTYGHRYGCHLVVRCGSTLPNYFKSSKLFHVGGDEFVAIIYGEDYQNFDNILKAFEDDLSYSIVEFEGQKLIFSLAYGYAKYEEGLKYKDVFQIADQTMYKNKAALKEKYGLAKR